MIIVNLQIRRIVQIIEVIIIYCVGLNQPLHIHSLFVIFEEKKNALYAGGSISSNIERSFYEGGN